MKKLFAICLALAMLCTAASAATWADGLSPQKPYTGTPEVDFTETIGYMMLEPVNGSTIDNGIVTIRIFMPREDVAVGEGTLYLHSLEDGLVEEIVINAESMIARPMTEEELDAYLWGCGTVCEVAIAQPLEPNRHFVVQLTEGSIVAPDYNVVNPAIAGDDAWTFNTVSENYVEKFTYNRNVEGQEEPVVVEEVMVGDTANFNVVIGETAVSAAVFCESGVIVPNVSYLEESAAVSVYFPANGEVEWGVIFLDADGNIVNTVTIFTEVNAAE